MINTTLSGIAGGVCLSGSMATELLERAVAEIGASSAVSEDLVLPNLAASSHPEPMATNRTRQTASLFRPASSVKNGNNEFQTWERGGLLFAFPLLVGFGAVSDQSEVRAVSIVLGSVVALQIFLLALNLFGIIGLTSPFEDAWDRLTGRRSVADAVAEEAARQRLAVLRRQFLVERGQLPE